MFRISGRSVFSGMFLFVFLLSFLQPVPGLAVPAEPASGVDSLEGSTVNSINPASIPPGNAVDLCFNVSIVSPEVDPEFLDRFNFDLPDSWVVNFVSDVPPTSGCGNGHTSGVEAGNIVYWQTNGFPSGCGEWTPGTYNFCANITLPNCNGSPWSLPWNITGDGFGAPPHSVTGTVTADCLLLPEIAVDPLALTANQIPGVITTQPVQICNTGIGPLDWNITEVEVPPGMPSGATPAGSLAARPVELTLAPGGGASRLTSPWAPAGPVSLVVDDGSAENYLGLNDMTYGYQFLWLNHFTPDPADFPFNLTEISLVLGGTGVAVGDPIDLVVYQDPDGDGDLTNAAWLATYPVTVQFNDGLTWNVFPLAPPQVLAGPGDVLIGVINRYQASGVEPPDLPAAIDTGVSQQRSWVGLWTADPPNPPLFPPNYSLDPVDLSLPGNWLIRASGATVVVVDVPWVSAAPITGTTQPGGCMVVNVSFDSTGLAIGTYLAALAVHSNDPAQPVVTLPLTLNVLPPEPDIAVTPLSFAPVLPGGTAWSGVITITNLGGLNLDFTITDAAAWLSVLPAAGTVLPGGSALVTATVDTAGLAPGDYLATITIASNDPNEPSVAVNMALTVLGPVIVVSPLGFTATIPYEGSWSGILNVANQGNASLEFSASDSAAWLDVIPVTGTVAPGANLDLGVFIDGAGLIPGAHQATISLAHNDPLAPAIEVMVNLFVETPLGPEIFIAPDFFEVMLFPDVIFNDSLTIWNDGTLTLTYAISETYSWLAVTPEAGEIAPGTNQRLAVAISSSGLGEGVYLGAIMITSNDADEGMLTVPVTLTVITPQPDIDISPLAFTATLLPVQPWMELLTIANLGDASLVFTVMDDGAWLGVVPVSGSVAAGGTLDLEVSIDTTGLAAGAYAATILISSNDPDEPVVPVQVDLTLLPTPEEPDIFVEPAMLSAVLLADQTTSASLAIYNLGALTLTYEITETIPWLAIASSGGGELGFGEAQPYTVTFDSTGLAPGVYTDTIVITSNDPDEGVLQVEAMIEVTTQPPVFMAYLPVILKATGP